MLPVDELRINVNTANEIVLGTLAPNFTTGNALRLVEQEREIARVEDITGTHPELGEAVAALTVQSAFFRVQVRAEVDDARSELTSLLPPAPGDRRVDAAVAELRGAVRSTRLARAWPGRRVGCNRRVGMPTVQCAGPIAGVNAERTDVADSLFGSPVRSNARSTAPLMSGSTG